MDPHFYDDQYAGYQADYGQSGMDPYYAAPPPVFVRQPVWPSHPFHISFVLIPSLVKLSPLHPHTAPQLRLSRQRHPLCSALLPAP
jgi:hypothetical protein